MIETIQSFLVELEKIQSWPLAALVVSVCVISGYILKAIRCFPNSYIPVVVIVLGAVYTSIAVDAHPATQPMRVWLARDIATGLIYGFIAWLLHNIVLARVEDWLASRFTFVDKFLTSTSATVKNDQDQP